MTPLPKHIAAALELAKKTARVLDCEPDQLVVVLGRDAYLRVATETATYFGCIVGRGECLYLYDIRILNDPDVPGETAYAMPADAWFDRAMAIERYKREELTELLRQVVRSTQPKPPPGPKTLREWDEMESRHWCAGTIAPGW